jgi:ankyrin repeat protein
MNDKLIATDLSALKVGGSLGCVLYWMVTQKAPFPTRTALSLWSNGASPFPSDLLDANKISDPGLQFIMSTMQIAPQKRPTASSALQCLWFENSDQNSGAIDLKAIKNELQHVETGLRTQHRIGKTVPDPVALASNETLRQHPRQGSFDTDPELGRDHQEILQDSDPATDREEISTEGQRKEPDLATEFQGTLEEEQDLETEIMIMPEEVIGPTALHNAAWEGRQTLVYRLLSCGADIEAKQIAIVPQNCCYSRYSIFAFLDKDYHCRQTPLHKAARQGHEAVVSLLLKMGANIEADDSMDGQRGWRPLHYAIGGGHKGTAQLLLDGGANIEAPGRYETRPLHIAAAGSWEGPFDLLLERGADFDAMTGEGVTPLQHVASFKSDDDTFIPTNLSLMKKLVDHGAVVNAKGYGGGTALHEISGYGTNWKAQLLLNAGAEVDATNLDGSTPLMAATRKGLLCLVCLLVEHGADVNMTNKRKTSALHLAVFKAMESDIGNWRGITTKLLENGADPRLKNMRGQTPLDIAKVEGRDLPELMRKGREEYLTRTQPTQPTAPKPRRGIRGWFSSREDKASLPHWH